MVLCVIEAAVAIVWMIAAKKRGVLKQQKAALQALLVAALLGLLIGFSESRQSVIDEGNRIERKEPGEGERTEELEAAIPDLDQKESYTALITERQLTEEEKKETLQNAEQEAEQIFRGNNPSLEDVREAVVLPKTLQNGLVEAEWSFDNYDVMQSDGTVNSENVPKEGVFVQAKARLSCQGTEQIYEFYFKVFPPKLGKTEQLWADVKKAAEAADEEDPEGSYYTLPDSVDGHILVWSGKKSNRAVTFAFLGAVAAAALAFRDKEDERKRRDLREKELLLGYPEMVSKLTLLLGAGMSVSSAWERIILTYQRQLEAGQVEQNVVYDEMTVTYYEMQDGMSERKAYQRFGERCGLMQYRKMISFITQNIRKGREELTKLLEDEAEEAFAVRRELAKKAGEEAGTKLLAPMMLMLVLVMAVILVPACMSFSM